MRSTPLYKPEERASPAVQLGGRGPVLDEDGHVVHQPSQGFGDPVQGVADKPFELLGAYVHGPSLANSLRPVRPPGQT